ncbi:coenzyme F420-0:L-glutamate ligase [Candidatus Daviesbacteria bacterium]|nr:coenzyme F420-0:L-glutamate ligase [Candidatus Daviesbacteria bacterium]
MKVAAIKTRKFLPPKDNLWELLSTNIKILNENSIVAVTSKVVSIGEGRCMPFSKMTKDELAIKEADKYIPRNVSPGGWILHTIKNNMLIASSGVDESNGGDYYTLWPKNPQRSAKKIWEFLRKQFKVNNLGVIITDSRLIPLRRGVVGIAIGYYGFKPLKDYRGTQDLFGREFRMETSNLPDSLATSAVLEMGEGAESQPIAIISDVPDLKFSTKDESNILTISEKEDMFYPFLFSVKWKKGKSGKY